MGFKIGDSILYEDAEGIILSGFPDMKDISDYVNVLLLKHNKITSSIQMYEKILSVEEIQISEMSHFCKISNLYQNILKYVPKQTGVLKSMQLLGVARYYSMLDKSDTITAYFHAGKTFFQIICNSLGNPYVYIDDNRELENLILSLDGPNTSLMIPETKMFLSPMDITGLSEQEFVEEVLDYSRPFEFNTFSGVAFSDLSKNVLSFFETDAEKGNNFKFDENNFYTCYITDFLDEMKDSVVNDF